MMQKFFVLEYAQQMVVGLQHCRHILDMTKYPYHFDAKIRHSSETNLRKSDRIDIVDYKLSL